MWLIGDTKGISPGHATEGYGQNMGCELPWKPFPGVKAALREITYRAATGPKS